MVSDNLAGHTAAQNTLGEDGLRDGDALSPATLTNLLQGVHGNGIIRYQDGAYDSTRNETNSGNQPGSIVRASSSTLTVSGGFAVLDGALYEFGNGVGNTKTLDLNDNSHGTGGLVLSANEEAIYTIYVAPSGGHFKIHYEGGSPVDATTGLYPSASNQYLIDFDTGATQDNMKAVVLAHVRVQFVASGGGTRNINIVEINDKRVFIKAAADFRVPLSLGSISSGEIVDTGDKGVNRVEHLNVVHNENGELTVSDTVNVHWVSHPRYGSFNQSPPSSSDAGYGQGPSRGADRSGGHAADAFYFAGRNNEQTGHYAVRLQGMGVDATSTALTTNGTWVVTADGDSFFMLSPNGGVTITLNPERDGSAKYMFPEGHIIEVCNDGAGSIVFDNQTSPTGLNATLSSGHRATFIYEGSVWVRCDYQSAIIGLPDPAIEINSGTPVFATGITKTEVQTLLNIEDGADVTDATNVTAAGALMDSEVTNLAFVKGLTGGISNGNVLVANAAVADNDFLKIDGTSVEGRTAAEMRTDLNVADGATANAGTVTSVATSAPITGGTITGSGTIGISAATTSAAGSMSGADKTKLDGIEASATADQTDAEIRAAVEAATDSNVFTDADHTKLNGIATGATAYTDADAIAAVEGEAGLDFSTSSSDAIIENTTQDKDIIFKVNDGSVSTEVMRIDGDVSRIGIGTDTPDARLHIEGSANDDVVLHITNPGGTSGSVQGKAHIGFSHFNTNTVPSATISVIENTVADHRANLTFSTRSTASASAAPTEKMRIMHSGRVGIGNTSPAQALDVTGTIRQSTVTNGVLVANANGDLAAASNLADLAYLAPGGAQTDTFTATTSGASWAGAAPTTLQTAIDRLAAYVVTIPGAPPQIP